MICRNGDAADLAAPTGSVSARAGAETLVTPSTWPGRRTADDAVPSCQKRSLPRAEATSTSTGRRRTRVQQRTEDVHTYSKDEVGHFISRLTTFYSEAMDDVGLTDEQIVDVVHRVRDKLTIDLLTEDYGEIPAPTDN